MKYFSPLSFLSDDSLVLDGCSRLDHDGAGGRLLGLFFRSRVAGFLLVSLGAVDDFADVL